MRFQAHALSLPGRAVSVFAQLLIAANLADLLALVLLDIFEGDGHAPPALVAFRLVLFTLLPSGLVWLIRRLSAATIEVEPARLVLALRRTRFELPLDAIAEIRPWRLPLPGAGLALRMKTGRNFRRGMELADPTPLLDALGQVGLGAAAASHPNTVYARARHASPRRGWDHWGVKFVAFPLLPATLMFRAHQYITYGGAFGQYQMYGLKPYLRTFAGYWIGMAANLVLYAAVWRVLAEVAAISTAWAAPSRARGVRRFAEIACRVAYYAGIPALILARFLM